jgi:hypothetical protein
MCTVELWQEETNSSFHKIRTLYFKLLNENLNCFLCMRLFNTDSVVSFFVLNCCVLKLEILYSNFLLAPGMYSRKSLFCSYCVAFINRTLLAISAAFLHLITIHQWYSFWHIIHIISLPLFGIVLIFVWQASSFKFNFKNCYCFSVQSTSVIPAWVITEFGYNRSFFHSLAVSLCFIIVTISITLVSYISHLQSHRISLTFPNSWFSSAILFLAK